jgi:hypothetical protein
VAKNVSICKIFIISAICAGWIGNGLAQEQPITDPIEPEEFQDPLAPTMTPGRGALAPQRVKESTEEWGVQVAADYGYVGSASLTKGLGTVTEQSAEVAVVADRRVQDDLIFLVGGNSQMFSFGYNGSNIPLPNNLLCLNMILGFDLALDEGNEWNMRIQIDPGVYGTTQSLGWHQVNVPGVVAFSNIVDDIPFCPGDTGAGIPVAVRQGLGVERDGAEAGNSVASGGGSGPDGICGRGHFEPECAAGGERCEHAGQPQPLRGVAELF